MRKNNKKIYRQLIKEKLLITQKQSSNFWRSHKFLKSEKKEEKKQSFLPTSLLCPLYQQGNTTSFQQSLLPFALHANIINPDETSHFLFPRTLFYKVAMYFTKTSPFSILLRSFPELVKTFGIYSNRLILKRDGISY